jgi:hypothetical protein
MIFYYSAIKEKGLGKIGGRYFYLVILEKICGKGVKNYAGTGDRAV